MSDKAIEAAFDAAKAAISATGKGTHHSERIIRTIVRAAIAAYTSALLPEDVAGQPVAQAGAFSPSWPARRPLMGSEMDGPIVGYKTLTDGRSVPLRRSEADEIMRRVDAARQRRSEQMPDERAALNAMMDAWLRLKELGWKEAIYCPKDGSLFNVIEAGSSGIHVAHYEGKWPGGGWLVHADNDLWPSRPILWRPLRAALAETGAEG